MKAKNQPGAKPQSRSRRKSAESGQGPVSPAVGTMATRIRSKWAWHYRTLLELRDHLRSERSEQLSQVSQPLESHSMNMADSATDELDHDLALAHLSAEQDALYEIDQALRRIHDGTYGVCEATGQRIAAARLRAIPWARFCQEAQRRLEGNGALKRERLGDPASVHDSAADGFEEAEVDGEQKPEAEPEDEALWGVRTPPAGRSVRGRRSPGKQQARKAQTH